MFLVGPAKSEFSWAKPENKHIFLGNLLCGFHFHSWLGSFFISYWKYADISSVDNNKIGRNESEKKRLYPRGYTYCCTYRGRSAIYNMARSPYFGVHPTAQKGCRFMNGVL